MVVPPYSRSRQGRLFRVLRSSRMISADRMRLAVRAQPIATTEPDAGVEVAREIDTHTLRDKIAHGQAIPTPEETYEQLWQQLQQDLDERYG